MMDWSQIIVALLLAWAWGRGREPMILAALTANFCATMFLAGDAKMVATIDALAFSILLMIDNKRADVVGALFALMIPVYWLGAVSGYQPWVAYVVVDLLCYAQIMVAGHGDNGLRNMGRFAGNRLGWRLHSLAQSGNSSSARYSDLDKG
jgi:hypothetical protein